MAKQKQQKFTLLPAWNIRQIDTSLIISGGADAKFEIDLESDEQSTFASLKNGDSFTKAGLGEHDQRVLEQLLTAEIVAPVLKKSQKLKVFLMGDATDRRLLGSKNVSFVATGEPYDIVLILRTKSTYGSLLRDVNYQSVTKPHLFVDTAFHHTVSVGPLVFPGETACLACLQGRISTRWGDEEVPQVAKATKDYSGFVSELILIELEKICQGDTTLTNKTVAWNMQDRVVKENQLLKVPLCPVCTQNKVDQSGALALPWR